jgi:glucose/arabinose dehydrogenase
MNSYRKTTLLALAILLIPGLVVSAAPVGAIPKTIEIGLDLVADGLVSPVTLVESPDETGRLFIVDQVGLIRILPSDGTLLPDPFLDLRSKIVTLQSGFDERGLLGLAFHPNYAENGRFFVYYSAPLRAGAPAGFNCTATWSEFLVSADTNLADPGSERILLQVDKPQFNHNGGSIAFGPDGYLYLSIGDGGGANDTNLGHVEDWYADNGGGNGQDVTQNLLGNILRIDVDGGIPYGIPADNPFVGRDGLDEIYAYGFRNPYRFSFDSGGELGLLVGDAGQGLWEEVDQVVLGGNYGWNIKEGTHCFDAEDNLSIPASCPDTVGAGHPDAGALLIDPVTEYANQRNPFEEGIGTVVVGGFVYRGRDVPQLFGRYVFADWSTSFVVPDGTLLLAKPRKNDLWKIEEIVVFNSDNGRINHFILGFGQDLSGEIYVVTSDMTGPTGSTGKVFKISKPGP